MSFLSLIASTRTYFVEVSTSSFCSILLSNIQSTGVGKMCSQQHKKSANKEPLGNIRIFCYFYGERGRQPLVCRAGN